MKQGEIDYLRSLGPKGQAHASHKPYSDPACGSYLIAMGQIMNLLPAPPARILDAGCGTGWTSVMLARRGYEVVGTDIAPDMIAAARALQQKEGLDSLSFQVGDYETLGFDDEFDAVVFFDALHHAEDERSALASAYTALRVGGLCVASEPGEGHSQTAASIRAVEQFGVTEKDMPPVHVERIARPLGFEVLVYPHLSQIDRLVANRRLEGGASWKEWILNRPLLRPLLVLLVIVRLKRRNGIVVLRKASPNGGRAADGPHD